MSLAELRSICMWADHARVEIISHEVCHALTIGLTWLRGRDLDNVEIAVFERLARMPFDGSDRNEVMTCAVQLRLCRLVGLKYTADTLLDGNVVRMNADDAVRAIEQRSWSESSYRMALSASGWVAELVREE